MADIYHGASVWLPGIDDITKFVQLNRQSSYDFEEAGFGGTANVFREFDGREDEYKEKTKKKLARELEIWRALSGNANIIELLGMTAHPGPLPSAVSPFCQWDLKAVNRLVLYSDHSI
ncbi:hypothetical protein FRC09_013243 [Ceratobasidium sp. 395]|nr:hypothetical protein FRC09_013243 [Ceratobasidium sp. 395]